MFPKLTKKITTHQIKIEQKFLGKKIELVVDRFKCVGCGICSIVCPKDAISVGPAVVAPKFKNPSDKNPIIKSLDETKCVFCGTCSILCPFDAIEIFENGKKLNKEENTLLTKQAIPKLSVQSIPMTRLKRNAAVYWEGTVEVKNDFPTSEKEFNQNYINKCPGDCRKCLEICPNEAISFLPALKAWEEKQIVNIDDDKCIKCGACQLVCPKSCIEVNWTKVNFSGPFNERFWDPLVNKVLNK